MNEFRYPESSAGGGRLTYHGPIPVAVVEGNPEQIGRQIGELALRPARRVLGYPLDLIRWKFPVPVLPRLIWTLLRRKCRRLYANIPEAYRGEIAAMAAACPDRGLLVPANTLFDMGQVGVRELFGCSSLVVRPRRSATGSVLFGRNLDFFTLGYLHRYSLVTVYRPAGAGLGFASVGFPGAVGCFSAMNTAGVCVASHEVFAPNVRRKFDPNGVPFPSVLRGVMETCESAEEAVDRMRKARFATTLLVVVADAARSFVAEVTPGGVFALDSAAGGEICTNHFRHPSTANPAQPDTYRTLGRMADLGRRSPEDGKAATVADVWAALHAVRVPNLTMQSMVFEPAARVIHVAFGPPPVTDHPPTPIPVGELLA